MLSMIDSFADKRLKLFREALDIGDVRATDCEEVANLLDLAMFKCKDFPSGASDVIRGLAAYKNELLLGSYDGSVRLVTLADKTPGRSVWKHNMKGRVLSCAFVRQGRGRIAIACTENGHIASFTKKGEIRAQEILEHRNVISVSVCPYQPDTFALTSYSQKRIDLFTTPELRPHTTIESDYHPRCCFWLGEPDKRLLCIVSYEGTVEFYEFSDGQPKKSCEVSLPLAKPDSGVYDATISRDLGNKVILACSVSPEETCQSFEIDLAAVTSRRLWMHSDLERCYAITGCSPKSSDCDNLVFIGGQDGGVWCYSEEGILHMYERLGGCVRSAVTFTTPAEHQAVAVTYSQGQCAVYWCPPRRRLLKEFDERVQGVERRRFVKDTEHLPLLATLTPTSLQPIPKPSCSPNRIPAMIGMLTKWLDDGSFSRKHWPFVRSLLTERKWPSQLRLTVGNMLQRVQTSLPSQERRDVRQLLDELTMEVYQSVEVNRFQKALEASHNEEYDRALELLPEVPESTDDCVWEPLYSHVFQSSVNDFAATAASEDSMCSLVTAVLLDGTLHEIDSAPYSEADSSQGPIQVREFPSAASFARSGAVAVSGTNTVAACDNTTLSFYRTSAQYPVTYSLGEVPLCAYLRGDRVLLGTAAGNVLAVKYSGDSLQSEGPGWDRVDPSPIWSIADGAFRCPEYRDVAIARHGSGVSILDGKKGEELTSIEYQQARSPRLVICDWDGDGLDELFFLDQDGVPTVVCINWDKQSKEFQQREIPVEGGKCIATARDPSKEQGYCIIVGCSDGSVARISPDLKQQTWFKYDESEPITALASCENGDKPFIVTARRGQVVVWHTVATADIRERHEHWQKLAATNAPPVAGFSDANPFDDNRVCYPLVADETRTLRRELSAPSGRPIILHGPPGVGKSPVLEAACDLWKSDSDDRRFAIHLKLSRSDVESVEAFGRCLARGMTDQISGGVQAGTRNRAISKGDTSCIEKYLSELRANLRKRRGGMRGPGNDVPWVVVTFEAAEVDGASLEDGGGPPPFVLSSAMKLLADWGRAFSPAITFVVVAERPLDSREQAAQDPSRIYIEVTSRVDRTTAREAVTTAAGGQLEFSEDAIDQIVRVSGGLADCALDICAIVWEHCKTRGIRYVTRQIALLARDQWLKRDGRERLSRRWSMYESVDRVALAIVAKLHQQSGRIRTEDYNSISVLARRLFSRKEYGHKLGKFCETGILERRGSNYCFASEGFSQWIDDQFTSIQALIFQLLGLGEAPLNHETFLQLNKELADTKQLDDVLAVLRLEASAWGRMVDLSRSFLAMYGADEGGAKQGIALLNAFVEHTNSHARSSPVAIADGGDVCWVAVQWPERVLLSDHPTVVMTVSQHLLHPARKQDLERAIARAFGDCQKAAENGGLAEPEDTLVLCGARDIGVARQAFRDVPGVTKTAYLIAIDVVRLTFTPNPPKALLQILREGDVGRAVVNPYQWEGHVRRPIVIVRRHQVEAGDTSLDMVGELTNSDHNWSIVGTRRIGKTTLLLEVRRRLEATGRDLPVYTSFKTLVTPATHDDSDILAKCWQVLSNDVASAIERTDMANLVRDWNLPDVASVSDSGNVTCHIRNKNDLQRLVQSLSRRGLRVILLFDEVDFILENRRSRSFFEAARDVAATTDYSLRSIVCGWMEVYFAKTDMTHPLYNFGQPVTLDVLGSREAEALILVPLREMSVSLQYEKQAVDLICDYASRHPSFLQCFLYYLIQAHDRSDPMISHNEIGRIAKGADFRNLVMDLILENFPSYPLLLLAFLGRSKEMPEVELRKAIRSAIGEKFDDQKYLKAKTLLNLSRAVRCAGDTMEYAFPSALDSHQFASLEDIALKKIRPKARHHAPT